MSVSSSNPNFPSELDIKPSSTSLDGKFDHLSDDRFGARAQAQAIETYGIAGRVWEASYAILAYLDRAAAVQDVRDVLELDPAPFTDPTLRVGHSDRATCCREPLTILELGSGTGLVAARIGTYLQERRDAFVATDLPEVCSLLRKNLRDCATVEVHPLAWGSRHDAMSLADLVCRRLSPYAHQSCLSRSTSRPSSLRYCAPFFTSHQNPSLFRPKNHRRLSSHTRFVAS
ncbi:uncharacterized protein B0H18DRAFT_1001031 [Fomitopsis serialis]|uniref:uncharacterized protein n=1 Tax=Fomitopsis serialis TaxID=139415 RepID=UPI0020078986|nr:uncharacterized protein B0H18DRAFT_1001031 [Neoantrodia serialis]KAH9928374.1 hypothetical protein B0H18DRAFT_1001031 [Neoantrodia serialis]